MSFLMQLFGGGGSLHTPHGGGIMWKGGYSTDSGSAVSEWNAATIPAVYACVGIISDAIAQLPIKVYRRGSNGRREHVEGHPIEEILNHRPNRRMTAFSFRKTLISHTLLWGNSFAHPQRTQGGSPIALWLALPDRTQPVLTEDGDVLYRTTLDGEHAEFDSGEMLHIPGMSFDGVVGYSPVATARQAMGLAKAQEAYGARFFGNDAKSGGFIKHPGRLSEEAQRNLRESMDRQSGPENAHRLKILEEGMEFMQTTIAPEDAQFLESRDFQVAEIARIYRVPLHMIQSVSGSTSWGSGIAEMSMGFVRFTLAPWMTPLEQEYRNKLLTQSERDQGYYVKHDTSDLLRGGLTERGSYYTQALDPATGWLTREEVRASEDKDPDEGGEQGGGVERV